MQQRTDAVRRRSVQDQRDQQEQLEQTGRHVQKNLLESAGPLKQDALATPGLSCDPPSGRKCRLPFPAVHVSRARRSRSAFAMTDTELKLMAAAASIGLMSSPVTG